MADDREQRSGDTQPLAGEGGNPDRDRTQHDEGRTPAEPNKG